MFGSLISATDPVAVVALLKEIGGSKILGTMIEGEALLNDGAAIVLFEICKKLADISKYFNHHGSHEDSHDMISGNFTNNSSRLLDATSSYYPTESVLFHDAAGYDMIGPVTGMSLMDAAGNATSPDAATSANDVVSLLTTEIIWKICLPILYGFLCGKITSALLYKVFDDMLIEVSFPLIMCYVTYYLSETLDGSGVLTCVVFGVVLDRNSICTEHHEFLHKFFVMLAHLANTIIFFLVGIVIVEQLLSVQSGVLVIFLKSIGYYIVLTVIRYVSTFICKMLQPSNRGIFTIGHKECLVMTWGGLRGAVSLCLALNIMASENAPALYKNVSGDIMVITVVIVLLTLIVNALTIKSLLDWLGMLEIAPSQHVTMMMALDNLYHDTNKAVYTFSFDPFLSDARWKEVSQRTMIEYPYPEKLTAEELEAKMIQQNDEDVEEVVRKSTINSERPIFDSENQNSPELIEKTKVAKIVKERPRQNITKRALKTLKLNYCKQFAAGTINQEVYFVLDQGVNKAQDEHRFVRRNDIKSNWEIHWFASFLKAKLEAIMFDDRVKKEVCPYNNKVLRKLYHFLTRKAIFDNGMQVVVFLNIPFIVFEIYFTSDETSETTWINNGLFWINLAFFIIYLAEFVIKIIGLSYRQYFIQAWNVFDFIILILAVFDMLIVLAGIGITRFCEIPENQNGHWICQNDTAGDGGIVDNILKLFKGLKVMKASKLIRFFKILRTLRALRFLKSIFPWMLDQVEKHIEKRLSFGYQVGRCYIKGQEELMRTFPSYIDNAQLLEDFNVECEKNRLDVDKDLGILQREKPSLAIAIKTKTAVRTILNAQKSQVKKFKSGGILDEHESKLLLDLIEKNMKSLLFNFPTTMEPPPESEAIASIPWLNGVNGNNKELTDFIKHNAEKMDFDTEDILIQEGEEIDGIYLLTSGMVRLFGRGMNDPNSNEDSGKKDEEDEFRHYDNIYSKENKFSYVHAGGLIGEMGIMLRQDSDLTAECETACTAYLIKKEHIEEAVDRFMDLKPAIWKSIGINVALQPAIGMELLEVGATAEDRRQFLEPAYFKDMWQSEQFLFDDSASAVILIYGTVIIDYAYNRKQQKKKQDEKSKTKIVKGPCLIKHEYDSNYDIIDQTFRAQTNNTGVTPKLLIVPDDKKMEDGQKVLAERITSFSVSGNSARPVALLGGNKVGPGGVRNSIFTNLANNEPRSTFMGQLPE